MSKTQLLYLILGIVTLVYAALNVFTPYEPSAEVSAFIGLTSLLISVVVLFVVLYKRMDSILARLVIWIFIVACVILEMFNFGILFGKQNSEFITTLSNYSTIAALSVLFFSLLFDSKQDKKDHYIVLTKDGKITMEKFKL